jgi:hypothetical protein
VPAADVLAIGAFLGVVGGWSEREGCGGEVQRERWGVKKKKLIEERVPEANAKLPPHLFPLLLFVFSLSLVAKRPTNLDDPAAVSLAELRHFRIDRERRCTEKKKRGRNKAIEK